MAEQLPKGETFSTSAITLFTIGSGIAGGLAQMILSSKLKGSTTVDSSSVLQATFLSMAFTLGAALMIKKLK